MNTLSWLIYSAEIADNIIGIGITSLFIIIVGGGMISIFSYIEHGRFPAPVARHWWVPLVIAFILAVTPSSRAIYLIAASEMGETVVSSPDGQEIMGDLKAIIKGKLKEQLGE